MKRPAATTRPSPGRMTDTPVTARAFGRRPGAGPRRRTTAEQRSSDALRFRRLAEDVLDRRDRNRRGGDVRPDSCRPLGQNDLHVPDPTGIAAVRRITGDYPHDPVAKRLAEDERDLARLAARMGATTPIIISHMYGAPGARFVR